MLHSMLPSLRRSWSSFVEVVRDPHNLVRLSSGSVLVTVGNIIALVAALAAFGQHPPIATVAVVYLAGSAIASAAPTPGGLGATEAALVAGLSLTGTPERVAVPAVLLFRAATFWLPILPGWIAFVHLQRRGDL
jgi:undecaprenyl-diphosphatase